MVRLHSAQNSVHRASDYLSIGVNGDKGVARISPVKAGQTIIFEWRDHPDDSAPGAIDKSHKGPCAVYMKKVDNAAANNNAAGDGWFKIMELGFDEEHQEWCTEKLNPKKGHLAAKVPEDLAPGYYLVRPELLALHQADKNPPDPQFYVGCAQIFLASDGKSKPKNTVSIPGYVSLKTPAMTYNVWRDPLPLPFPNFGPPLYQSGKTRSRLGKRAMVQTQGLKPDGCVMENANWCAFMPPSYADQDGCWAVSHAEETARFKLITGRLPRIATRSLMSVTSRHHQLGVRTAVNGKNIALLCVTNVVVVTTKAHYHAKIICRVQSKSLRAARYLRMVLCVPQRRALATKIKLRARHLIHQRAIRPPHQPTEPWPCNLSHPVMVP